MTGATLEVSNYELSYDDLKTNAVLSETFNENLRSLGITEIHKHRKGTGSVDIGNISNVCPTIHPYIGIADCEITFVKEICKLIAEYPELSDEEIAGIKNTNENAHMED